MVGFGEYCGIIKRTCQERGRCKNCYAFLLNEGSKGGSQVLREKFPYIKDPVEWAKI